MSMADPTPNADTLRNWYARIYGHVEEGWLSFFAVDRTTGENHTRWCRATDLDEAAEITRNLNQIGDVWNGVAIRTHRTSGRGGSSECGWVTALWADIDFVDPGHRGNDLLPPDEEAAKALVRAFPIKPTAVIHSGGGLQAWHLLDEVTAVDELGDLLAAYGATWAKVGEDAGYHIDNVFDLARIMRAPGTINRKIDTPRPVSLIFADWTRTYGVGELRDLCVEPPEPYQHEPKRAVPYIGPDRPGDEYSARHDGHELLMAEGFHSATRDNYGNVHYRAPHRGAKEQTGATVYVEDGHTTIYSETYASNRPGVEVRRPYDPFGLYVAIKHAGDFSTATRELRGLGYGSSQTPPAAPSTLEVPNVDPETGEILDDPEPAPARTLTVRWVDDAVTDPPPEPDVIVHNLIRRGELTVLGAPRAIGKTWASLNLAHLAAMGDGHLFGAEQFAVERPATVLYMQGELGEWGSAVRWQMVSDGKPQRIAEVFDRVRIKVVTRRVTTTTEGVTVSDEAIDVSIDDRIEATIEAIGADLVILDPWATYYAGKENDNDQTEAAITAITDIARRTGTAWWIVHHITAKASHGNLAEPEDLWRGSSRLADAVSTRLTILPHYTPAKMRELHLDRAEARKFIDIHHLERNGPPVPLLHARRDGWWWNEWDPETAGPGRPPQIHVEDVIEAIEEAGAPISKSRLADALDVSRSTLDDRLNRLIQMNIVTVEPGPRNASMVRLSGETERL